MNKITAFWNSLSPTQRRLIMLFAGAAGGVLKHALDNPCNSLACWKGYLVAAIHAGVTAVVAHEFGAQINAADQPATPPPAAQKAA